MLDPNVLLTYLEGSDPLPYGVRVGVDSGTFGDVKLLSHQGIPSTPESGYTFVVVVDTTEGSTGEDEIIIDLGTMGLHPEEGEVEIQLVDSQSQLIGKKKVRAEEAQKETRPTEFS